MKQITPLDGWGVIAPQSLFGTLLRVLFIGGNVMRTEQGKWILYIHRNKVNGKIYVGITSRKPEDRWGFNGNGYRPDGNKPTHFWAAILKYGWKNFEHIVILDKLFKDEAELLEQQYITLFDSYNNGYNSNLGGSIGSKGYKHTEQAKKNMALKRKGSKHSEEWCKHISEAQKCNRSVVCLETGIVYDNPAECAKKLNIHRQYILNTCRGAQHSTGGLHFQFADSKYKTIEEIESERKEDPRKKKVICMETGEEYKSVNDCCQKQGIKRGNIQRALVNHNTANGLHYKFADDPITLDDIKREHDDRCSSKVRCVETGMIFPNITECAKYYKTSNSNIYGVCKNTGTFHTVRGYHLEFIDYKPRIQKILCETTGEIFSNQKECAEKLHISAASLGLAINRKNGEFHGLKFKRI